MDFAALFADHCSGCHGAEGKLGPAPPLNDPLFLAIVPESVLRDVIRHGRPDTLMTGFGGDDWDSLRDDQIDVLISQLPAQWGGGGRAPKDAPPYQAPPSNDGHGGDPVEKQW
ncbi:MAG: cytochrome c [Planctomycetes bacterium]|nr:cytochrome c [Planctomycetota bacterium]